MDESSSSGNVVVSLIDGHATIRIRSEKRRMQLVNLVSELERWRLTVIQLNVKNGGEGNGGLYCLSLKVEDDCKLSSGNEITTVVHQILGRN